MKPVRSAGRLRRCDRRRFAPGEKCEEVGAEMLSRPPALVAGQETRAPRRESKEAFTGSEVQVTEARLWQPGGVCLWKLQPPTQQIARFLGAIICQWRHAFTFPLPQSAGRTDSSWQTGSTPAAEMMQSWRDNWWAAGSCLMETHFANLSRGCGVRAAAVSQSNTVFRAFFLVSSSFLCWGLICRSRTNPLLWLRQRSENSPPHSLKILFSPH